MSAAWPGAGVPTLGGTEVDAVLAAQVAPGPARDRLVQRYMPLIGSIARTYAGTRNVDRGELMQEGVVGLLRALRRYDPEIGTSFWAYASWWVRQAMQQLVSEMARPIVLSDRALRQLARVEVRRARLHAAERPRADPARAGRGHGLHPGARGVPASRGAPPGA